ncbi:YegP family protein [Haloplanus halobius]|uniref:YegP family protein n=1 Tax=Haloplanus halobius TaxID=2934938 RepID=UPI00200CE3E7|nr:YegP family protein [Haloplanus sp. XH21]
MVDATFEVFEADAAAFGWRLRHDGTTIATSDGTYPTRRAAMVDIQRIKHAAPEAGVESVDREA